MRFNVHCVKRKFYYIFGLLLSFKVPKNIRDPNFWESSPLQHMCIHISVLCCIYMWWGPIRSGGISRILHVYIYICPSVKSTLVCSDYRDLYIRVYAYWTWLIGTMPSALPYWSVLTLCSQARLCYRDHRYPCFPVIYGKFCEQRVCALTDVNCIRPLVNWDCPPFKRSQALYT